MPRHRTDRRPLRSLLREAGLRDFEVHPTHSVGDKLHSAIIRATKPRPVRVTAMTAYHADTVLAIYQQGLNTGDASFETAAPDWTTLDAGHLPEHRFVAVDDEDRVLGWVAVGAVSSRCVYAGVVEHSVYVSPDARDRGVGAALLRALITSTETAGVWTIQSGVFPENLASRTLHRRLGFREVGVRQRIGAHHGRWRDVVMLERRSSEVGIP